jgi:NAD(P)-dependent dehydrogenase (short-subunit alcohol dehydrogenase family)
MARFDGKVALVTGGASGIGQASAVRLRAEGARIAVADLAAPAEGVADLAVQVDVADSGVWPGLVGEVERALGGLDLVHLNAGVTCPESDVEAVTDEQWHRIFRINVDHVFFGIRATAPALRRRGGGAIVCTASLAGLIGMAADPIYAATKHAVVGLVRSVAPQLLAGGVRLQAVCPGIVDTPMVAPAREAMLRAGFPLLRPEDVADAVVRAVDSGGAGECFFVQLGREPAPFQFRNAPGPRVPGAEGMLPPL